mgnify:CR=1 FL=1
MTIAFYLQNNVEILDFAGPLEVFNYAGFEVFTVSKTTNRIKAQGVLTVQPDYSIANAPKADIIAFFGGNSSEAADDPEVIGWLRKQDPKFYFSVCTGAFMLAKAGLLDGKTATTFHDELDRLEMSFPEIKVMKNVRFVDNGNVITTAGVSAGIDGALHLVARIKGIDKARKTAYYMEYDKWMPGEGLILCEENPYQNLKNYEQLAEFEGKYEFSTGEKIQLKLNHREKGLEMIRNDRVYPLFSDTKDRFQDVNDKDLVFDREEQGKITGFVIEGDEKTFTKVD